MNMLFAFLLIAQIKANDNSCAANNRFDLDGFIGIRRQADKLSISDVKRYCYFQMAKRFSSANPEADLSGYWIGKNGFDEVLSQKELDLKINGDAKNIDLWGVSMLPAPNTRWNASLVRLGFQKKLGFTKPTNSVLNKFEQISKYFSSCASGGDCPDKPRLTDTAENQLDEGSSKLGLGHSEDRRMTEVKSNSVVLEFATLKSCLELTVGSAINCKKAVESGSEFVKPDKTGMFAARPLYIEILSDGKYARGLSVLALKMIRREKLSRSTPVDSSFYDDIVSSFIEAGANEQLAIDMSWNVIGLWATAGANLDTRLNVLSFPKKSFASAEALRVMAALLPILDSRSTQNLYSFPKEVKNSCDNGKSYHFWLSAYLARKETIRSGDPIGAAAASFTLQKGYQIMGRTSSKERRSDMVLKYDSFSSVHNVVRMDLNYSASGATFGAAIGANKQLVLIDADQGLSNLHSDGLEKRGAQSAGTGLSGNWESYNKWMDVFNPNPQFIRYIQVIGF